MTNKPETVAISEYEGLGWIPWRDVKLRGIDRRVHAIKFADGSSWDAFNGWRHQPKFETIDAEGWAEAAFTPQTHEGWVAAWRLAEKRAELRQLSNPDWR